jgi:hypothetical protein
MNSPPFRGRRSDCNYERLAHILDDHAPKEECIGILCWHCPPPMLLIAANESTLGRVAMEFRSHVTVALRVNGTPHEVVVDTRIT